jgi:hypothetical protein
MKDEFKIAYCRSFNVGWGRIAKIVKRRTGNEAANWGIVSRPNTAFYIIGVLNEVTSTHQRPRRL